MRHPHITSNYFIEVVNTQSGYLEFQLFDRNDSDIHPAHLATIPLEAVVQLLQMQESGMAIVTSAMTWADLSHMRESGEYPPDFQIQPG